MMYVGFMKNFFSPIRASRSLLDSSRLPEPRNVCILLSGHGVLRVREKFSCRRFRRADACYTHFGFLSPKTFDSYFLDMMYFEFVKNFLLAESGEQMPVRLISASWAQKRLIPIFQTWCTSDSWKISSPRFERADRCWTHLGFLSPETFVSCFLDMVYFEFVKNFLVADFGEQMHVTLISASWAGKRLIPTF